MGSEYWGTWRHAWDDLAARIHFGTGGPGFGGWDWYAAKAAVVIVPAGLCLALVWGVWLLAGATRQDRV